MRGRRVASALTGDEVVRPSAPSLLGETAGVRDYEHELMLWRVEMARLEERISALGHHHDAAEAETIDAQRVRLIAQLEWLRISQPELRGSRLPVD